MNANLSMKAHLNTAITMFLWNIQPTALLLHHLRNEGAKETLSGSTRLNTIVAIAMLALYAEFDTYWQNGGYKKISDIIFAEWHIFIVSNLC
jgi:hypothetical protein